MEGVTIDTDSVFKSIECYWMPSEGDIKRGGLSHFTFKFGNEIHITIESFWRLLKDDELCFISTDNGHLFGGKEAVDVAKSVNEFLAGKKLEQINIKPNTADLVLRMEDNIVMEVFISSMGYESYNLTVNNKSYIGMGGGKYSLFLNNKG